MKINNFVFDKEPKKLPGRPKKVDTEKLLPKPRSSKNKQQLQFSEEVFLEWMLDCATIVEQGWELKTKPNKHWIEVIRSNDEKTMPFAFIDRKNGNIHCPALMHGDPHEDIRGNISDPQTRLSCITPTGAIAYWPWQPTHPNYNELHQDVDFVKFSV